MKYVNGKNEQTLEEKINLLEKKFNASGQNIGAYLDGMLHANYLNYWDYVNLDTLLTLQSPKTNFPDEMIFVAYHQISELYFKLILHEAEQLASDETLSSIKYLDKIKRINRYILQLTSSFDIMVDGMEANQFQQFRMSLLPSSGFQSAQYRKIEIMATTFDHLLNKKMKSMVLPSSKINDLFEYIYWKEAAIDIKTGEKTLTLYQFEQRYEQELISFAERFEEKNLWSIYSTRFIGDKLEEKIIEELKRLDYGLNIEWALSHFRSAVKYLKYNPEFVAKATGGTNWREYLPPRFKKLIFFPSLWSEEEIQHWGRKWVEENVYSEII